VRIKNWEGLIELLEDGLLKCKNKLRIWFNNHFFALGLLEYILNFKADADFEIQKIMYLIRQINW